MAAPSRQQLNDHLPLGGAIVAGGLAAVVGLLLPAAWLSAGVAASGLADLVPAAAPPLGPTARAVLALGGGAAVAAVVWATLYLLWGAGGLLRPRRTIADTIVGGAPTVRRADRHPDAPPRRPLSIAELGAPPAPVPSSPAPSSLIAPEARLVPVDLDTPLATFDPAAILPVPREPIRPVAPLAPGERLETFALTRRTARPPSSGEPPSIEALLRRLERSAERRVARAG